MSSLKNTAKLAEGLLIQPPSNLSTWAQLHHIVQYWVLGVRTSTGMFGKWGGLTRFTKWGTLKTHGNMQACVSSGYSKLAGSSGWRGGKGGTEVHPLTRILLA